MSNFVFKIGAVFLAFTYIDFNSICRFKNVSNGTPYCSEAYDTKGFKVMTCNPFAIRPNQMIWQRPKYK